MIIEYKTKAEEVADDKENIIKMKSVMCAFMYEIREI